MLIKFTFAHKTYLPFTLDSGQAAHSKAKRCHDLEALLDTKLNMYFVFEGQRPNVTKIKY